MSDIKLFKQNGAALTELESSSSPLERALQTTFEQNLETLLGVRFLASEYATSHGGRMDTLGIDENGYPVIIEYKRQRDENIINQGLFYLDWLMDHRGEFELLVRDKFDKATADAIEWSAPRLICIAASFTKFDEHAIKQMSRNIELIRYRKFGDDLLMLDLLTAVSTKAQPVIAAQNGKAIKYKTNAQSLGGQLGKGIAYSDGDQAPANSYNENLSVENDDQKMFLRPMGMNNFVPRDSSLSNEGASELYWSLLIQPLQGN